jgi:heterodisulfide reductase subunit C/FixJ family two-component response regulator/glycine cleavage system H lipoate-binding protein
MDRRGKFLVVDDEPVVCKSCRRILTGAGHEVDTSLSAVEALKKAEETKYDVIVTDLKMPGMSGLELLEAIKGKQPDTDVIIITGYATIDTAVKAMRLGAFDYIPKPFTPDELLSVTSRAIERRRMLQAERERSKKTHVLFDYHMPDELYYLPEHAWARILEDGLVDVGMDDVYQRTLPVVEKIDLPAVGTLLEQGSTCCAIHCPGDRVHKTWSPVSGEVVAVNEVLEKKPVRIKEDPYGEGWMVRVEPSRLEEDLKNLLHGGAMVKWWLHREIVERREDKYVQVSALDPKFKYRIAKTPGGEHIKSCFACGVCTAVCPIREIDNEYNPRKIIRMALLGMKERVLNAPFIWLCSTCYQCAERCPQGVKFTDVISAIKNIAVEEGHIHPSYVTQADLIRSSGRLYPIDPFDNRKREKLGLPALPTEDHGAETVFEASGMNRILNEAESKEA